ncbi:MAG: hypothetical protein ACRETL_12125, partial [Gammaproteobacteria bacterium]
PVHLICRWKDWPGHLCHEQRLALLISAAEPDEPDPVEVEAANTVFAATGEDVYVEDRRCYSKVDVKVVQRLADRAQLQRRPWSTKPSFKEQEEIWTTNSALLDLAIALASAEPKMVHLYLDAQEVEYQAKGYLPGDRYMHDLLRKYKPAWALARQWAGGHESRKLHEGELDRLRRLVHHAVLVLYKAHLDDDARKLERSLGGL